ncbi:putative non-specific serine/threonine protein kinase [Rosa chinensis]|uniref:Putative non-specific serine/threonine protein kinase n=1 Tax=Rosa chinensis TaxID=74649 RepID=A0A2P6QD19_ROSCH|nr:putative non-specific serine/threonine protein kinase [Rosa chinensis]
MSSLNLLALSTNNLNGSVPDNMCQHLLNHQGLYLSKSNFDGQLPSKWSRCKHLLVLSMGYNNFSGSTPKDIWNLTQIKTIYLGSNYLTGTIPNEIGHLPCLEEFVLGGNNLSGLIPTSIFNMSTISTISLDSNQFSDSREKFQQAGLSKTSLVNHFFLTICGASLFQVSACRRKTGISIFKYVIPGILSALLLVTSILIL